MRPELRAIKNMIIHNSEIMWQKGRDEKGLISRSWQSKVEPVVQLCAQLSGIMLIEITALLGPNFENQ